MFVVDLLCSVAVVPFALGAGVGWSAYRDCMRECPAPSLLDSILAGFCPFIGRSCDSLRRELDGRATLDRSKSRCCTFCRLLDGVLLCADEGGVCCEVDTARRGELEAAAARVVALWVR